MLRPAVASIARRRRRGRPSASGTRRGTVGLLVEAIHEVIATINACMGFACVGVSLILMAGSNQNGSTRLLVRFESNTEVNRQPQQGAGQPRSVVQYNYTMQNASVERGRIGVRVADDERHC